MTLGQQIKAHRTRLGLSQDALAERLDVSRQAVTKWESGKAFPSTERLLLLAQVFECRVDDLTGAPEPEPPQAAPAQKEPEPPPAEIPRRFSRLFCRLKAGGLTLAVWVGWFFLCKLLWADLADQTVLGWLFGDSPRHHAYLFGWLLDKYWWCAVISLLAALLGKTQFAAVTTAGFLLGMLLGEPLGTLGMPSGIHQGWIIWGGVYLASLVFGIFAQCRRVQKPWRTRLWWIVTAVCVAAVIVLALASAPAQS